MSLTKMIKSTLLFLVAVCSLSITGCAHEAVSSRVELEDEPIVWLSKTSNTFVGSRFAYNECGVDLYADADLIVLRSIDPNWKGGKLMHKVAIYRTASGMFMKTHRYFHIPDVIYGRMQPTDRVDVFEISEAYDVFKAECQHAVSALLPHVRDKFHGFYGTTLNK